MDKTADAWRSRLLSELKQRHLSYRKAATLSGMQYSTVQKHLSGNAQFESLWFIRNICRGTGIPMAMVLFGIEGIDEEVSRVPVLDDLSIEEWLAAEPLHCIVPQWLPYPSGFAGGLRVFAREVISSDLAPLWPVGSWLYIDPEIIPATNQRRLVLAQLDNSGYLVRWVEPLAGELWLVPETSIHNSVRLASGRILGSVIGGVKSVDL